MPAPLPHLSSRLVGALTAMVVTAAALSGCAATTPSGTGLSGPAPAPISARSAAAAVAATTVDEPHTSSVLLVPAHPRALAVFVHGSGQTHDAILTIDHDRAVAQELARHGYVVLAADADDRAWGDPASVQEYERLITWAELRYDVHQVDLVAESMGGLATMQLAARMQDVAAVTAWYPVCDLRTMEHKPAFAAAITKAWAGLDRSAVSPVQVPPVPMMVWASPDDTVVDASRNAAVCVTEGRAAGGSVTYIRTTGNHGDRSNFHPAEVLAFFDAHLAPRNGIRTAVEKSSAIPRP
ncbi:MAG TPA: hypothetical protein VIG76_12040 [Amnibacterium sp.]|uniref:alpha/beta hydrolase family protein n=1 Tax=Amnibacterium sp. TaxID=1872496 RepID=UPI002F93295A